MNVSKIALLLAVILLLLAFTIPAASEPGDAVIVNNADEVKETTVSIDQSLVDSLAGVAARVVLQYANELRHIELAAVPGSLQTLLDQVSARVVVQYANLIREEDLTTLPSSLRTLLDQVSARVVVQYANIIHQCDLIALPSAFQTLLEQVSDRVVIQYANTNRQESLAYPTALFNDTTAPQLSGITVKPSGSGSVIISWTTGEFAASVVYYGTQPGVYPNTVSDPLYTEQHGIVLTGLLPETTYYFLVSSTDQSDNTATSAEQSFSTALYIVKSVTPQGQVDYGDELTYSVVISAMLETQAGLYDPLEGTTFVHFLQQPGNVIYDNNIITGTLTVPSGGQTTVSFVVQIVTPTVAGVTVDVTNRACVYPTGGTIAGDCTWSNEVTNEAFRPYGVYLPVVLRSHVAP